VVHDSIAGSAGYIRVGREILRRFDRLPVDVHALSGALALLAPRGATGESLTGLPRGQMLLVRASDAPALRVALPDAIEAMLCDGRDTRAAYAAAYSAAAALTSRLFWPDAVWTHDDLVGVEGIADVFASALFVDEGAFMDFVRSMDHTSGWAYGALNTAVYALAIGIRAGAAGDALAPLARGAMLHDIGKVRLPAGIVDIAGDLSPTARRVVQTHPAVGCAMLRSLYGGIDPDYSAVVLHHQERMDGSGYPDGLVGEAIPPGARIVAVAEVFDALTCARPNREAMGAFEALRTMRDSMVGQFDDALLVGFIKMLAED
jgi:hypothetical protein